METKFLLDRHTVLAQVSVIRSGDIYRSANGLRMYTALMSIPLSVIVPHVYEKLAPRNLRREKTRVVRV